MSVEAHSYVGGFTLLSLKPTERTKIDTTDQFFALKHALAGYLLPFHCPVDLGTSMPPPAMRESPARFNPPLLNRLTSAYGDIEWIPCTCICVDSSTMVRFINRNRNGMVGFYRGTSSQGAVCR